MYTNCTSEETSTSTIFQSSVQFNIHKRDRLLSSFLKIKIHMDWTCDFKHETSRFFRPNTSFCFDHYPHTHIQITSWNQRIFFIWSLWRLSLIFDKRGGWREKETIIFPELTLLWTLCIWHMFLLQNQTVGKKVFAQLFLDYRKNVQDFAHEGGLRARFLARAHARILASFLAKRQIFCTSKY